jgi:hypothetical protein
MPRDAVIDVKGMHHSDLKIALERSAAIAAKAHTRRTGAPASRMFQRGISETSLRVGKPRENPAPRRLARGPADNRHLARGFRFRERACAA